MTAAVTFNIPGSWCFMTAICHNLHRSLKLEARFLIFGIIVFETHRASRARVSGPLNLLCVIAVEWNSPKPSPACTGQRSIPCRTRAKEHSGILWGRAGDWEPCRVVVKASFSLFHAPGACLLSMWSKGPDPAKFYLQQSACTGCWAVELGQTCLLGLLLRLSERNYWTARKVKLMQVIWSLTEIWAGVLQAWKMEWLLVWYHLSLF